MEQIPSFNELIEKSIIDHWHKDALTDFKGAVLQYHDVARKIAKLHIMFESSGVKRGDKVALCGRNSSAWACAFLATLTYGAVAVPILHEFTADQIHNIVNHSDAKLLFVGDVVATQIDTTKMPHLEGVIYIPDYSLVLSRTDKLTYAREHLNEMFGHKYPKYFRQEHISYYKEQSPDELALINYTSGTTGFSKGVMVPYRALWSNADFAEHVLGNKIKVGDNIISILPMAHMYGMSFEFLFEFIKGCHIFFLTRIPSPAIIAAAFAEVKPRVIISVPLIIEKIIKKKVFPKIQDPKMRLLMKMPGINRKVYEKICTQVTQAFGGNFYEIIIGAPRSTKRWKPSCTRFISTTQWAMELRSVHRSSATPTTKNLFQAHAERQPCTCRCVLTVQIRRTSLAKSYARAPTSCWDTIRTRRPLPLLSTRRDGSTRATSARWTPTATYSSRAARRTCC